MLCSGCSITDRVQQGGTALLHPTATSGVHNDPDKQSMVRAMLGIAADFGITPLAEGIETAAEMTYLKNQGVRLAQGYHFCRPMPVACERLSF